jgi:hypothetical protein
MPTIIRLAAESCRDPRTVEAVLRGKATDHSRAAVIDAARRLGIDLPPLDIAPRPSRASW